MRIRSKSMMAWLAAGALALSMAACGDDSGGSTGGEGGADAGADTGGEGGADTGGEGGADTGGEGGADTGGEGGADTGGGEGGEDTGGEGGADTGGEGGTDTGGEGGEDTGPPPTCDKEEGNCTVEYPEVFGNAMRVNAIQIGQGGQPGEALDVDLEGDADCSPVSNCSAGVDNALTIIAGFANGPLAESVADGSVNIIAELTGDPASGAFGMNMYVGDLDETNAECDNTMDMCKYTVSDSSWGCDCSLLVQFEATLDGDTLVAGGPDAVFSFSLPIQDVVLDISAYKARIEGTMTIDGDGNPTLTDAVLGGAVRKSDLVAALSALPPGTLPIDPGPIINGLAGDVDTDGDGEDDALSIGLKISGSPSTITGVKE